MSRKARTIGVPDLVLERYRLGELPDSEARALEGRLASEPGLRLRLEALERSDADVRERLAGGRLADGIRARLGSRGGMEAARDAGRRVPWWLGARGVQWPAALAVAAAVVLAVSTRLLGPGSEPGPLPAAVPAAGEPAAPPTDDSAAPSKVPPTGATGLRGATRTGASESRPRASGEGRSAAPVASPQAPPAAAQPTESQGDRIKGLKPALAVYRRTRAGSETLADGDVAHAGDLIRVGYRSAGRRYGVIVSLDGRGGVTRHLPEQGDGAASLQASDVVLLDRAYELDDAPGFERFYFVTAETPFEVAVVVDAARRAAGASALDGAGSRDELPLPRPLEQCTFVLAKER